MFGTEGHMAHHLWHVRLRGESATAEAEQRAIAHQIAGKMGMVYEVVRHSALTVQIGQPMTSTGNIDMSGIWKEIKYGA